MRRFCVTARMRRPNGVARSTSCSAKNTRIDSAMIHMRPEPIERPPSWNEPDMKCGRGDQPVVGAEDRAHRLLQDQRNAPGREQRFQRSAVEKADDEALDQHADEPGNDEGQRQRDRERPFAKATAAAGSARRRSCRRRSSPFRHAPC